MNTLNLRQISRILQLILSTFFIVVVFGNGCSDGGFKGDDISSGVIASATCKSATQIDVIPGTKTVSFVNSGQVLNHLASCIGLAVPSDTTRSVYDEKRGSISTYGAANTITPPMMMAIASLAGEICSDLIDQENASVTKRIFPGFDFSATNLPTDAQLSTAISNIALSCWQTNETAEERTILINSILQSVTAGEANATRKAALMMCTSMLSSVNALLN